MGEGPRRTCIGCRAVAPPEALIRVVRTAEGGLAVGRDLPGRGAWLCRDQACLALARKRRAFARALRGEVHPDAAGVLEVAIAP